MVRLLRLLRASFVALERLLLLPDNDLLDLVMGKSRARESDLAALVEKLRAA